MARNFAVERPGWDRKRSKASPTTAPSTALRSRERKGNSVYASLVMKSTTEAGRIVTSSAGTVAGPVTRSISFTAKGSATSTPSSSSPIV